MKSLVTVIGMAVCMVAFAYNGGYENGLICQKAGDGRFGNDTIGAGGETIKPTAAEVRTQHYAQCKKLTAVDLSGLTEIGDAAFAYSDLRTLTIPASVTNIGYIAFGGCSNLTSVTVNSWAWYDANKEPFRDCSALTTATVAGSAATPPSFDVKVLFPALTTIKCPSANVSVWKAAFPGLTVQAVITTSLITLSKSGGTGGSDKVTATVGAAMPAIDIPTRTGYAFGGYRASAADGNVLYYDATGKSLRNWDKAVSSYMFYAVWTSVKTTSISFSKSGGTGGSDKVTATVGAAMPAIDIPTRTGYVFSGYRSSSVDGNVRYYGSNGKSLQKWDLKVKSYTLYALWTKEYHTTISFSKSGGTDGSDKVIATYTLPLPSIEVPMRTGYVFGGYRSSSTDGSVLYYDATGKCVKNWGKTVTAFTLYAIWNKSITSSVVFSRSGGTGGSDKVTATVGAAMPAIDIPKRAGYAFGGYRASAADGSVLYYDATGKSMRNWDKSASSYTLYAVWSIVKSLCCAPCPMVDNASTLKLCSDGERFVSGCLADDLGFYEMLVDEDGDTGYVRIVLTNGSVIVGECGIEHASEFWILQIDTVDSPIVICAPGN